MGKDTQSWLKSWRKGLGLSQKQAAALLGLKHRMIQNYEGGSHKVPRYIRLSCFALSEGIVDFGPDGGRYDLKLKKYADSLLEKQKAKEDA